MPTKPTNPRDEPEPDDPRLVRATQVLLVVFALSLVAAAALLAAALFGNASPPS